MGPNVSVSLAAGVFTGEKRRASKVQLPAGPGTPLAQDIHQQLAQDLLGLNWLLGCSVSVSVCCEGRSVQKSLSELCLEDTPRGEGPVFLFLPHSFLFQSFEPYTEGRPKDDCAHSIARVTDAQKI